MFDSQYEDYFIHFNQIFLFSNAIYLWDFFIK